MKITDLREELQHQYFRLQRQVLDLWLRSCNWLKSSGNVSNPTVMVTTPIRAICYSNSIWSDAFTPCSRVTLDLHCDKPFHRYFEVVLLPSSVGWTRKLVFRYLLIFLYWTSTRSSQLRFILMNFTILNTFVESQVSPVVKYLWHIVFMYSVGRSSTTGNDVVSSLVLRRWDCSA